MDETLLRKLLTQKTETDWLEFKRQWNLFDASDKVVPVERDELIKDILGLANGNSSIVRKTKYLVIGADDKQFDTAGKRVLHSVDYRVPTQSQITQWVNKACSPAVTGIECDSVEIDGRTLYVVTIPPTFELHEITRELKAKGHHSPHTVFMRQDEHTVPASIRDAVVIQQLKSLYRHETVNPSALLFGAAVGTIFALIFWNIGYNTSEIPNEPGKFILQIVVLLTGGFLGLCLGFAFQQWKSVAYEWRYLSLPVKIVTSILLAITIIVVAWLLLP